MKLTKTPARTYLGSLDARELLSNGDWPETEDRFFKLFTLSFVFAILFLVRAVASNDS